MSEKVFKNVVIIFVVFLFMPNLLFAYTPGDLIIASQSVIQGSRLEVYLRCTEDTPLPGISGVLYSLERQTDKQRSSNSGFIVNITSVESGFNSRVAALFIGVPSSMPVGNSLLRITVETGESRFEREFEVTIQSGEFPSFDIRLGERTTALLATPDPEKTRQSRVLYSTLRAFNPMGIYTFEPFEYPVTEYRVSSEFADGRVYIYSTGRRVPGFPHTGLDMAAPTGTPILAPGPGMVVFAEERIVSGNTVIIEHLPGVFSVYYHMNAINAEVGQLVQTGDVLGEVGETGLATGPHLHWELRIGLIAVDSEEFITRPLLDTGEIIAMILEQEQQEGGD